MADIATSILEVGSNRLILQDAEARTKINDMYITDTASGSIATFPDGADNVPVKDLKVNVEPEQDLHGYDSPWPAGGGKNLMRYPYTSGSTTTNGITFTVNSNGSIVLNGTATAATHFNLVNGRGTPKYKLADGNYILSGTSASTSLYIYLSLMKENQYVVSDIATTKTAQSQSFTISGYDYDSIHCGVYVANGTTLNNVVIYPMIRLASISDATFAPYENVCPIYGRTQAHITHTGKNFIKYPYETNGSTSNGITFTVNADGMITMNGTSTAAAYFRIADDRSGGRGTFKLPAGNYILSDGLSAPNNNYNIYMSAVNGSTVVMPDIALSNTRQNFTIPEDLDYTHFRIGIVVQSGQTLNNLVFKPMIRLATDTGAAYELYNGQTITIDLNGTRYGGTLDVTTGVLTVDRAFIASYNGETLPSTWISDRDVYAAGTTPTTGAQVCYKLATPQTVQLTANEVKTLLGQNNIWNDCGSTDVEYRADTKLYIEKLTGSTE